jgi:hypothetical protein
MTIRFVVCAVLATGLLAPTTLAAQSGNTPVAQAFDHYEAIRVALAADQLGDIGKHAGALAPLAGQIAGKESQALAEKLAAAKTVAAARDVFGNLSMALVPKFMGAKLPGVVGYMCTMKSNATWAQRGNQIQNPYFGKTMLNCGVPIKQ